MLNVLHFIAGMIQLFAFLFPIVAIWEFLISYQELKEQKEVGLGLLGILYIIGISCLLILFSICLASLSS